MAKDLSSFIELAETVRYLDSEFFNKFKYQLYHDFFKFANRPEILKDIEKLKRANQLNVQLLEHTSLTILHSDDINYR